MKLLKITAVICCTAVTIAKILHDGDGLAVTALFTLIGSIVGAEIATKENEKTKDRESEA